MSGTRRAWAYSATRHGCTRFVGSRVAKGAGSNEPIRLALRRRPAPRRSGIGFFGPIPTYTRRTRRGARVSVGGCCLPIPLVMSLGSAYSLRRALRRR